MPTTTYPATVRKQCEQCYRERPIASNRKICQSCRSFNQKLKTGVVRSPEYTEVNVSNYKEPMQKVEDGYGYYGAITTTNDGELIQCHICGFYFGSLGTHARIKHNVPPRDYKMKYGLRLFDGLVSPLVKARLQDSYNKNARKTVAEFRAMSAKAQIVMKAKGIKRGGNNWSAQTRNEKGMCREQTIAKIKAHFEANGHRVSQRVFYREYGAGQRDVIEFWFGNWTNSVKEAGLPTNKEYLRKQVAETKRNIIKAMRKFYKQNGRTPQWSDFQAGTLGVNVKTVQAHYGNLNYARQEAKVPLLVYSGIARRWIEVAHGTPLEANEVVPSARAAYV